MSTPTSSTSDELLRRIAEAVLEHALRVTNAHPHLNDAIAGIQLQPLIARVKRESADAPAEATVRDIEELVDSSFRHGVEEGERRMGAGETTEDPRTLFITPGILRKLLAGERCYYPRANVNVRASHHLVTPEQPPESAPTSSICPFCDNRAIRSGTYKLCRKHDTPTPHTVDELNQEAIAAADAAGYLRGRVESLLQTAALADHLAQDYMRYGDNPEFGRSTPTQASDACHAVADKIRALIAAAQSKETT